MFSTKLPHHVWYMNYTYHLHTQVSVFNNFLNVFYQSTVFHMSLRGLVKLACSAVLYGFTHPMNPSYHLV